MESTNTGYEDGEDMTSVGFRLTDKLGITLVANIDNCNSSRSERQIRIE